MYNEAAFRHGRHLACDDIAVCIQLALRHQLSVSCVDVVVDPGAGSFSVLAELAAGWSIDEQNALGHQETSRPGSEISHT